MKWAMSWTIVTCAMFLASAALAEMTELPPGPDRELVATTCSSCHDLQMLFDAAGINREVWDAALDEMVANGMAVSPQDRARILNYLSTYLGPSPPSTATSQ